MASRGKRRATQHRLSLLCAKSFPHYLVKQWSLQQFN
jgi:hypothetical protein